MKTSPLLRAFIVLAAICVSAVSGNAQLVFQSSFGSAGSGQGQFDGLSDIAIHSNGNIYAANKPGNEIQVFDPAGNFLFEFGSSGSSSGQFNSCNALVFDENDNLYVMDQFNYRIQKFDDNGNFILAFGSQGNGAGQFNHPNSLGVSNDGNVYVADGYPHNKIHVFSGKGVFLYSFGGNGTGAGQFTAIYGVGIINDKVYALDLYRIQVFDLYGNLETEFLPAGNDQALKIFSDGTEKFYLMYEYKIAKYTSDNSLIGSYGAPIPYGDFFGISSAAFSPQNKKMYIGQFSNWFAQQNVSIYSMPPEISILAGSSTFENNGTYYFNNVGFGTTGTAEILGVQNTGWGELTLYGNPTLQVGGLHPGAFPINPIFMPLIVPGNSVGNFYQNFVPTIAGVISATLTIQNDDADESTFVVNLSGLATNANAPVALDINSWLVNNPDISSDILWQTSFTYQNPNLPGDDQLQPWENWSAEQKQDLQKAFNHIFNWHFLKKIPDAIPTIPVNRSADLAFDYNFTTTEIYHSEAWQLYVNWIAQSLFMEAYDMLPWSMNSFGDETRKMLLSSSYMMKRRESTFALVYNDAYTTHREEVTGWSTISAPLTTYQFLVDNQIIEPGISKREVIERLLQWCNRDNMFHFFGGPEYSSMDKTWQYKGGAPVKKIIDGTVAQNTPPWNVYSHWTAGCHGTSSFLKHVLRAVNIPVEMVLVCQNIHNIPVFPTEDVFMSHGDDPYSGYFHDSTLPTAGILIPGNFLQSYFGVPFRSDLNNTTGSCENIGVHERMVSGTVYGEDGLPLPGVALNFINTATVFQFPIQTEFSLQTDVNGNYSAVMMPGTYTYTVSYPGYDTIAGTLEHLNYPLVKNFTWEICDAPTDLEAGIVTSSTADLSWMDSSVGNYVIGFREINTQGWATKVVYNSLVVTLDRLAQNTAYEARVYRLCNSTSSVPGNTIVFATSGQGGGSRIRTPEKETPATKSGETMTAIYPNPVQTTLHVNVDAAADLSKTHITIQNSLGMNVWTGVYQHDVDVSGLPAGVYIMIVSMAGQKKMLRFVKK